MAHIATRLAVAAAAVAAAALGAEPAGAGTFHVYGLGLNGAGCPNGWQAQTFWPDRFRQGDFCSRWEIQSVRDGTPLRNGMFAGASMYTGPGARFTGFSMRTSGTARNGTTWQMAMCTTALSDCQTHSPYFGTWDEAHVRLGSLATGGTPRYATHLWAGVRCNSTTCADSTSAGRAVQVTHRESHAVVEDYTAPGAPSIRGVSSGWNSGARRLAYSASDASSGIASATLTIDGSLHRTITHSCSRLPAGGYSRPVPCATSTGSEFTVNEPGQLADGRHTLTVTARDAGGLTGSRSQEFWVDNNAPGHPLDLAVVGGDGWRGTNDFAVTWENPDQGAGSEIAAAYYKVGAPPTTPTDGTRVAGAGITRLEGLRVPRDGDWTVHVWLEDRAGNAHSGNAVAVHLRLDTTAPTLSFVTERDPHNPAEVRVTASDAHSGVATGRIDVRRQGTPEWQAIPTTREGTTLVATVPDERLERGTYELRATAVDAVGNSATSGLRSDGQPMVLELPLREDTQLSANIARGARGSGPAKPTIRVRYRRRALLRGVLRSDGVPLPDTRLAVYSRRLPAGEWHPFTEVVTDGNGRYAVRLPRGASRELRVGFPGTRVLRPADDVARLLVRGWASLELRPRRLRRGGTITFRGRVGLFDAVVPPAGKLIQIQYLEGRRWRPAVKLGHTDRRGRFRIRYRFKRISRPTRISFRILVPTEGGWPYARGASAVRIARVRP